MIAFIIECTVSYNDVWRISFRFLASLLLRANHNQRKLACRLKHLIFLHDFLCVSRHVFRSGIVSGFWTFYIIYFVSRIMSSLKSMRASFLLLFLDYASSSHYIKSCLSFCDNLPVLMFLKADILLLQHFLSRLGTFID